MNYPYLPLVQLLQLRTTVTEYQHIITPYRASKLRNLRPSLDNDYWELIPHYLCTCCPICGMKREETLDTYSLLGWSTSLEIGKQVYIRLGNLQQPNRACPHLFTYHCFINLHGISPIELWAFSNTSGEAPIVTPWFLPDDLPSYIVLHALPICRIEGVQFIPSYTLFMLSYYSENPELVWQHHLEAERKRRGHDPDFWPQRLAEPEQLPGFDELYDLQYWATGGKLGYLDFTQPELPLRIGPGTQLPDIYRNIQGAHYSYMWRDGEFIAAIRGGRRVLKKLIYPS